MGHGTIGYANARRNKRNARGNRRGSQQNDLLEIMGFEIGERKRIVIPVFNGEIALFAKPYHKVVNESIEFVSKNGKPYNVFQVRCTHPYSQVTQEDSIAEARKHEICAFCDLSKYEGRRVWDIINKEYGDTFKDLEKSEQREVFKKIEALATVEPSYYQTKDEDGNTVNATQMEIYMLVLEIEMDGKKPVLDNNGIPKYKPVVMKASKSRLDKFKNGVDDAVESGSLDEDMLYTYIENEGTDDAEKVSVGWVDFNVNFPNKPDKKESGKDMSATPVAEKLSVITEDFINAVTENGDALVKSAKSTVDNMLKNFRSHTREEAIGWIKDQTVDGKVVSGEEYFKLLEAEYRFAGDDEHMGDDERDAEIFEKTLKYADDVETETDDADKKSTVKEKAEESVQKEDEEEKRKRLVAKAKAKKLAELKAKKEAESKAKEAEEELDLDEDLDLDLD